MKETIEQRRGREKFLNFVQVWKHYLGGELEIASIRPHRGLTGLCSLYNTEA